MHSLFRHARPSATERTNERSAESERGSLTSREMNHTLFSGPRVVRAFTRVPEIERGEREGARKGARDRRGELWKESGSIDREIRNRGEVLSTESGLRDRYVHRAAPPLGRCIVRVHSVHLSNIFLMPVH